jgi:hypothetical protein
MIAASALWRLVNELDEEHPGSGFVKGENVARRRSSERFIVGCVLIGLGVVVGIIAAFMG